jgi:large subunit ribosomal protein L3
LRGFTKEDAAKEGYEAIQVGFGPKKESRLSKPEAGHAKAAGKGGFYFIKEFRVTDAGSYEVGQEINLTDLISVGDLVDVRARTKGRGFQGVVRRYGFKGGRRLSWLQFSSGAGFHRLQCLAQPGYEGQENAGPDG